MEWIELARLLKEVGISTGAFILCAYICIYIVKELSKGIDKMVGKLEIFMSRVHTEHKQSQEQHKSIMDEHKEMMMILGRINGYKK